LAGGAETQNLRMEIKKGIGVSPGVAICAAVVLDAEEYRIPERRVKPERVGEEIARLEKALAGSREELTDLRRRTAERLGTETASIFDFHLAMLADESVLKTVKEVIQAETVTAEFAVSSVLRNYAKEFLQMPKYWAERVKDVWDIENRILRNLIGQSRESLANIQEDVVVLAHDLTPSQTASLNREHIRGLATDAGGQTSHTAIVAKALGIPAVVGLNDVTTSVSPGDNVIIDGNHAGRTRGHPSGEH
jgi:phosphotransferase system enzyme I (PtsI)